MRSSLHSSAISAETLQGHARHELDLQRNHGNGQQKHFLVRAWNSITNSACYSNLMDLPFLLSYFQRRLIGTFIGFPNPSCHVLPAAINVDIIATWWNTLKLDISGVWHIRAHSVIRLLRRRLIGSGITNQSMGWTWQQSKSLKWQKRHSFLNNNLNSWLEYPDWKRKCVHRSWKKKSEKMCVSKNSHQKGKCCFFKFCQVIDINPQKLIKTYLKIEFLL